MEDNGFITLEGFDECIIGIDYSKDVYVYDADKILEVLIRDGMNEEEAVEYFDFNIAGLKLGENTPILMMKV